MNRLFFALDINPKTKTQLRDWRSALTNNPLFDLTARASNFKEIDKNNFHLTLCFLGEVNTKQQAKLVTEASQIAQSLMPINSAQLLMNELGFFKKPKIVYLSNKVSPPWLLTLAKSLSNCASNLAIFQENRPYFPHISLYRKANHLPKLLTAPNIKLTISSFSLYQSISSPLGVKYQAIQTWRLQ